jgi:hypothetical protein
VEKKATLCLRIQYTNLWGRETCVITSVVSKRISEITVTYLGIDVVTPVVMKITLFCHITLCSPFWVNRRFGGTYRLHLQDTISRARYQNESRGSSKATRYVPPKRRLHFNGLHDLYPRRLYSSFNNQLGYHILVSNEIAVYSENHTKLSTLKKVVHIVTTLQ